MFIGCAGGSLVSETLFRPGASQQATRHDHERRRQPTRGRPSTPPPLEALGTLPGRTGLGHRARGLQRRTGRPGTTFRTTTRGRAPTAGTRTASRGICDRHQRICFALALWNERDPILKERLFGLTGTEGNHGEDVKEYYFYLDSTPTHSYMKCLYKYPQAAFPYEQLVDENRRRGRGAPEFELIDTGVFDDDRYFDVFVEYAKAEPDDILIAHHGRQPRPRAGAAPRAADGLVPQHVVVGRAEARRPSLGPWPARRDDERSTALDEPDYGRRWLYCDGTSGPACSPRTRPTPRRLFGASPDLALRQGRLPRRRRPRQARGRQSRRDRHQGGGALSVRVAPGETVRDPPAAHGPRARRCGGSPFGDAFDATCAGAHRGRRTRSTRGSSPTSRGRRRSARDAPGARRSAVVQAVLPLRRQALARRAIPRSRRRRPSASTGATTSGRTSSTRT